MGNFFEGFKIKSDVYTWTSIWVLIGLSFGFGFVYNKTGIDIPTAFLWSAGFFMFGGLGGFIFGVPKIISNSNSEQSTPIAAQRTQNKISQENTNLTQISDWLTKIFIGATLVELYKIPHIINQVSLKMAGGISKNAAQIESISVFSGAIIVYFSIFGFLSGYLIMRLIITKLLED